MVVERIEEARIEGEETNIEVAAKLQTHSQHCRGAIENFLWELK